MRRFNRFSPGGLDKARTEWTLACLCRILLKRFGFQRLQPAC